MNIQIVTAKGAGTTLLSAFDNALQNAGISNYNIIILSSIIPPDSKLTRVKKYVTPPNEFGDRLYVVRADQRSDKLGKAIGAGIGWYQLEDGRGFFVEHETEGESEEEVKFVLEHRILNTLADMCAFRKVTFNKRLVHKAVSTALVTRQPACALAIAVYRSEPW
jgi:arginine decarboxylase